MDFSEVYTLADLRKFYPKASDLRIKRDRNLIHFIVNKKIVFTKTLIF